VPSFDNKLPPRQPLRSRAAGLEETKAPPRASAEAPAGDAPAAPEPPPLEPPPLPPAAAAIAPVSSAAGPPIPGLGEPVRGGLSAMWELSATGSARVEKRASIHKLYEDPQFHALYDFVMGRLHAVEREQRGWDKLGQARSFAAAVAFVMKQTPLSSGAPAGEANSAPGALKSERASAKRSLFSRYQGAQERRALCHLLLLLMPPDDRTERPMMPNGTRAPAQDLFRPFPDAVLERADEKFPLRPGDLPKPSPIFTRHLTSPDLAGAIFKAGQQGLFLASKRYCPGAFVQDRKDINPPSLDKKLQSGHEGDPIMVRIDEIVVVEGQAMARVHVPAQHKVWLNATGECTRGQEVLPRIDVVLDERGEPLRGADGGTQPILIPVEHLAGYLLDSGDGARPLDFKKAEDRCLALTFAEALKQTWHTDSNHISKTLFDWLEQADERTPPRDVERIREAVRQAAFQAVARHCSHPRRTHFTLDVNPEELAAVRAKKKRLEDADWQVQAFLTLEATGIMRDCGNYYEKDKASTAHVHELAWTAQFLKAGFIGGSLDCLGASDAYEQLSKTFLEPLGIITTTGIAEGHGASLVRVLGQPDEDGVVQAGVPMKVKLNELIVGLEMPLSSGRGPAAQYMENWGGYLRIDGVMGPPVDFAAAQERLSRTLAKVP
jgi:hypothetical protein